jgi:FlaA1/EpsC-like NDP-sugar epimerase
MYYTELYDFKIAFNNSRLFIKLSQALAVATVVLAVFFYMAPSLVVGRGVLLSGLVLTFCFVVAWRMLYQGLLSMRQFRVKVLIIGTGEEARKLAGEVLSKQPFGYELRGFVGEDNEVGRDVM